eukprot:CAMPEP_0203942070 /NCGR_PEP_ID=MMETSP0359-20131031/78330_1 /ASSEMBLY_ACC=CAM_ASM_000338 /TAXON_ID=268821 /ORGANISM="Scrippsiella Hangoei, Strain SHTV-5" /LENGTH=209 /DNA_ID=CAMNT_0050872739 /DNA_START=35 /DNA_END=664 /DNA_ORIENTATION=-
MTLWCSESHDDEYPEDDWNLYQSIDRVEGLNTAGVTEAIGIFKPRSQRREPSPSVLSNADGELILKIWFRSPVNIRRFCVAACGAEVAEVLRPPSLVRCFTTPAAQSADFPGITEMEPVQTAELPENGDADISVACQLHAYSQVPFLLLHISGDKVPRGPIRVSYIGFQGTHCHASRQAVDAKYEPIHAGHDVQDNDEEAAGDESHQCM